MNHDEELSQIQRECAAIASTARESGKTFEEYMNKNIFKPLHLNNTRIGVSEEIPLKATGYKIGFFSPRRYDAPVFRGNNPAGYIVSNAKDITRWLKLQIGLKVINRLL